jgi:hypothetical protein
MYANHSSFTSKPSTMISSVTDLLNSPKVGADMQRLASSNLSNLLLCMQGIAYKTYILFNVLNKAGVHKYLKGAAFHPPNV